MRVASALAPSTEVTCALRAEGDSATTTATAPAAAPATEAKEDKAAEDAAMAERIFKLLQRKLVVERERIGIAGRFGRFG